jgi:hypothetical protein
MHSARFGSPYAKILPRNHFTLKKMGVSDAMEANFFICKTLTGNTGRGQLSNKNSPPQAEGSFGNALLTQAMQKNDFSDTWL